MDFKGTKMGGLQTWEAVLLCSDPDSGVYIAPTLGPSLVTLGTWQLWRDSNPGGGKGGESNHKHEGSGGGRYGGVNRVNPGRQRGPGGLGGHSRAKQPLSWWQFHITCGLPT